MTCNVDDEQNRHLFFFERSMSALWVSWGLNVPPHSVEFFHTFLVSKFGACVGSSTRLTTVDHVWGDVWQEKSQRFKVLNEPFDNAGPRGFLCEKHFNLWTATHHPYSRWWASLELCEVVCPFFAHPENQWIHRARCMLKAAIWLMFGPRQQPWASGLHPWLLLMTNEKWFVNHLTY